jgi:hypothetical protein
MLSRFHLLTNRYSRLIFMVSSPRHALPSSNLITIFVVLQATASLADSASHAEHPTLPSLHLRNPVLWLCSTCPGLSRWRWPSSFTAIYRDLASLSIRQARGG